MKSFILSSYHRVGEDDTAVEVEAVVLADNQTDAERKATEAGFDMSLHSSYFLEEVERVIS